MVDKRNYSIDKMHPWLYLCRYGFFKNKRIVLFDTLVDSCTEEECVAVLAHELGGCL